MRDASGHIHTAVDVEIISARRGKLVIEIEGIRRVVKVGDTLTVHADVNLVLDQ